MLHYKKIIYICSMATNTISILEEHGIRSTPCRKDMMNYFAKYKHAVSFPELEKALSKHDRTSVYRNIVFFEEQGFIHKLNDASGIVKYALCKESCFGHKHEDNHIHFTCFRCDHTFCLNDKHTPKIKVPKKFNLESYTIVAKGICDACK
jgi:Fur family ferric uptake transcriptional regulator